LIARGPDHPDTFEHPTPKLLLDSHSFGGYYRSTALIDNNQLFVDPFDKIIGRCTSMLSENAYLYQYEKYGLEKQRFVEYLAVMEGIQQNYIAM
jgi:tubulin delta